MSVRNGLLALLAHQQSYGYELRADYERSTGTGPINVGQIYTTLRRLERDGLVVALDTGDAERTSYALTDAGASELKQWFATPLDVGDPGRDELVAKVHLAITTPGVDAQQVIATQRAATLRALQATTAAKARTAADDIVGLINTDYAISRAESELQWLELASQRLARSHRISPPGAPT